MSALQIQDVDQKTMTLLQRWAADHGRTLEDAVRVILQRVAAQIEVASNEFATRPLPESDEARQSRGALSLQPMVLSAEDAAILDQAWQGGLARPKIAIAPLPQYEG
jgi:plasmid stability protein